MKLLALAVAAAGLCIASAIADAAPSSSATTTIDRWFWSLAAGFAVGMLVSRGILSRSDR